MTSVRKAHPVALATLGYVLLTLAYSWPLPRHILHGVAHDAGDPILNAWILWWSTKAVPFSDAWWNAPMFAPATGALAFSEHLLGEAPVAWPIIALTNNPLLGYNAALLASYVFCGLGAYFLAFTITRRHDASFVAGMAYAFAPYRLAQLPHIQVQWSCYAPVCLAALHRYERDASWKWAALAAGAWLLQSLANGYFMFFFTVLLACWLVWFAAARWPLAKLARIGACFAVAALLLLPVVLGYHRILVGHYGLSRSLEAAQAYGADIGSLLHASEDSWLWGWVQAIRKPETELFPGPAIAALALFAIVAARPFDGRAAVPPAQLWARRLFLTLAAVFFVASLLPIVYGSWHLTVGGVRLVSIARADKPVTLLILALVAWLATQPRIVAAARQRSALTFYALAAFMMWAFALGPDPEFFGRRALYQAPYGWLMRLPGFDGLRVPARFWMMALVCLSAVAALAVNRLQGRTRRAVAACAVVGLALDGWPRAFAVLAQPEHRATPVNVAMRLDLPMDGDHDALALYQQTFDGVPVVNGYSGYDAPHAYAMRTLLNDYDPRILRALAARGPLAVVIDHAADPQGDCRRFVQSYPGAALQEMHAGWSSYRIPSSGAATLVPERSGETLPIKGIDAFPSPPHTVRALDGNRQTRWSGGVQRSAADFTIELQKPSHVGQLVTDLGEFWTDFPVRLEISVSPDGRTWEQVFLDGTALIAYYGALREPKMIPLVFPIGRDNVRFIRLRQLGWGAHDWSIAEVHVLQ